MKVTDCPDCPFYHADGTDWCWLGKQELMSLDVPKDCPLRKGPVTIKLEEK